MRNNLFRKKHKFNKYKYIYIIALPSIIYIAIFKILPLFGLQLAFKSFDYKAGIWGSEWVGIDNFKEIFSQPEFWRALKNTLIIGALHLLISFPISIIFAIFLSEIKNKKLSYFVQIISVFPHFLSWVLVSSMMFNYLGNSGGINEFLTLLGLEKISFFSNNKAFRWVLVFSYIWKETGWNAIIYYAAICGINKSLYEAAEIDGANRFQRIIYITIPSIKNIIVTMFLIQVGGIFAAGFSQVFNLYNATVYETADILETYIYRLTFASTNSFGLSAAVSLLEAILNALLLLGTEFLCRKTVGESLFGELFSPKKEL